jgi:hypothetical protein
MSKARINVEKLNDIVSVVDFGAVGDGVTDDTAAFNAAIASLPLYGGTVFIPSGNYRVNLVITKSGVRLLGEDGSPHRGATTMRGLRPYNLSLPVITIGNDTGYVEHVTLDTISIVDNANSGAQVGLRLAGGTYAFYAVNLMIAGFQQYCLHIQGGTAYPCAYVYVTNFSFANGQSGPSGSAVIYMRYGNNFTTAMFFSNGRLNNGFASSDRLLINDSCEPYFANTWFEAAGTRRGIQILKSDATASSPNVKGSNSAVDSSSASHILVEIGWSSILLWSQHIRGSLTVDGILENNAAATSERTGASSYEPQFSAGEIVATRIAFPNVETSLDTSAQINAFGPANARSMGLSANRFQFKPITNDGVRVLSPDSNPTTAGIELQEQDTSTQVFVRNVSGELRLVPATGQAVQAGDGTWNSNPLRLGAYYLWVDATGDLRIKSGVPSSDTDGTVVGTQS